MNRVAGEGAEQRRAFPLGPDQFALFAGRDYRRALEGLAEDLRRGVRLLCLVGPPGIGKSMLLRSLRARLQRGWIGELTQPPLGGVLSRLANSLGLGSGADEREVLKRLQEVDAAGRAEGLPILQIVDDAETLTREDVALLRRLFGPVRGQLLLVGQPPLLALLEGDWVPPDRAYHLEPLSPDEVGAYLRHRLNEAGLDRGLFDHEAVMAVSAYSGGVPRLINLLCFTVLADMTLDKGAPVTAARIHDAARHRAIHGSYPFLQPPPAPGGHHDPAPENVALVVGERPAASDGLGYGRLTLILTLGIALGVAAARLPSARGLDGVAFSGMADEMSGGAGRTLQDIEAALTNLGDALAARWSPPVPPAAAPEGNAALFEESPAPEPPAAAPPPGAERAAPAAPQAAAAPPADDGAVRLSDEERRHLARLYAERAQYEMHASRWADARVSILRGLRLLPEDPQLQGLDRGLRGIIAQRAPAPPLADGSAPRAVASPSHATITRLYRERAEYEWQNGRLQDALASINSGLEEDPGDGALLDLRRQVTEDLAAQQ